MKRSLLTTLALGASLVGTGYLVGQTQNKSAAPAAAAKAPEQKLIKMVTLNSAVANREFQNNVQLLQAQRQEVLRLNGELEKEKDAKKKAELKTQLDTVLAKLNENNDKMSKAYGFSLARNYVMEVEVASVYLIVSDEEAAKLEAEQKKDAGKKK